MFKNKIAKIGVSASASWAWGTSLILGMEIAQQRGLKAFIIWAVANCCALGLFGYLVKSGLLQYRVLESRLVKGFALIIQAFCLIIQLNIINQILSGFISSTQLTYAITSAIGMLFVVAMYKRGLPSSIKTDLVQWTFAIVCIVAILAVGLLAGVPRVEFSQSTTGDLQWALWSACILLSGVMGDVQHWQRAKLEPRGYYLATGLFALYLGLILLMACLQFNPIMQVILLLATLGVTTSTIDSIAVAMHTARNKKLGTALCLFLCLFWGVFIDFGIMAIWSKFGAFRVFFALMILFTSCHVVLGGVRNDSRDC